MVRIQSEIKRGFLRQIYTGCHDTAVFLEDALVAFQAAIFSPNFQRGRIIVSTSGGGQQGSFTIPNIGQQFSQDQIFALSEELLQIYTDTLAALVAATPTFDPRANDSGSSEQQMFAAMMLDDRLNAVRREYGDHTLTRFPTFGPAR